MQFNFHLVIIVYSFYYFGGDLFDTFDDEISS